MRSLVAFFTLALFSVCFALDVTPSPPPEAEFDCFFCNAQEFVYECQHDRQVADLVLRSPELMEGLTRDELATLDVFMNQSISGQLASGVLLPVDETTISARSKGSVAGGESGKSGYAGESGYHGGFVNGGYDDGSGIPYGQEAFFGDGFKGGESGFAPPNGGYETHEENDLGGWSGFSGGPGGQHNDDYRGGEESGFHGPAHESGQLCNVPLAQMECCIHCTIFHQTSNNAQRFLALSLFQKFVRDCNVNQLTPSFSPSYVPTPVPPPAVTVAGGADLCASYGTHPPSCRLDTSVTHWMTAHNLRLNNEEVNVLSSIMNQNIGFTLEHISNGNSGPALDDQVLIPRSVGDGDCNEVLSTMQYCMYCTSFNKASSLDQLQVASDLISKFTATC